MSKVALVKCSSYEEGKVKQSLKEALALSGAWEGLIKKGSRVLIKPNMLAARSPEEGVTTHPALIRAVVELVQEAGGKALIGDSPGGLKRDLKHFWKICGYWDIAQATGAELVSLEQDLEEIEIPEGVIYKKLYLPRQALLVDVLINVPKLKTHSLMLFTGAVKNMLGLIPGMGKVEFHRRCPRPDDLGEAITDVYSAVKPQLSIMDAIVGMEGNGPVSRELREVGLILASADAVALDTIAQAVIGLKPSQVSTTVAAARRGLGISDLKRIEIKGESLGQVSLRDFHLPSNIIVRSIPRPLLGFAARRVTLKPIPQAHKCTGCGICLEHCPTQAISLKNKIARVDYEKCILCLCCDELCPEKAFKLKKSLLAKLW